MPAALLSAPRSPARDRHGSRHARRHLILAQAHDDDLAISRRRLALLTTLLARPATAAPLPPPTAAYRPPPSFNYSNTLSWPRTWPACGISGAATPFALAPPFTPAPRRRLVPAYRPAAFIALDAGTTVHYVAPSLEGGEDPAGGAAGGVIVVGDDGRERRFTLTQFHFHRPAEELLPRRRRRAMLGVHLVHVSDEEPGEGDAPRVLVVAASIERGDAPHPALATALTVLDSNTGRPPPGSRTPPLDPRALLPAGVDAGGRVLWFKGALSSPPCATGVDWAACLAPAGVGTLEQARAFDAFGDNARPLQARGGRRVYVSGV